MTTARIVRVPMPMAQGTGQDILRLMHISFSAEHGERWSDTELLGTLALPNVETFAAYIGTAPAETMVGFALLFHGAGDGEILLVAVDPAQRRTGIAGALMAALTRSAQARGHLRLFLEVRDCNAPAQALYARLGFSPCGRRKSYYRGSRGTLYDAITMHCLLQGERHAGI